MIKRWVKCLGRLVPGHAQRELDEELRFHLDMEAEANRAAGMSEAEARRRALVAFGGLEKARAQTYEQRPTAVLESLAQDTRYAVRGFRRNPVFTLTLILTMMLGIGVTTAVFSVVDRILFRPLPYSHGDRLVSFGLVQSLEPQEFMAGGFFFDWRDRQQPFEAVAAESAVASECDLTEGNPVQLSCTNADAHLLPMLGVAPVLGRNFLPEEDRPNGPAVALITNELWTSRYHADPGILNRPIDVDGKAVQVIGVLPRGFRMPSLHVADVISPMSLDEAAQRHMSPGRPMRAFARLKPGISLEEARAAMDPLFQSARLLIPTPIRNDFHLRVRSLRDRQMQTVRPAALALFSTASVVLLIACANMAGLLLARSTARSHEQSVRIALGASRVRLARQAAVEAVLIAFTGGAAGLGFAAVLLRALLGLAPADIPYLSEVHLDLRVVCFTLLLALLSALLFGLVPGLHKPNRFSLSTRAKQTASHARFRQVLVATQIGLSVVLLAGAALLLRSFYNLQQQQLGLHADTTLTASFTLGEQRYGTGVQRDAFYRRLSSELRYAPGVSAVAVADSLPPAANHNQRRFSSIGIAGRMPSLSENGGTVTSRWVSPDYFRSLGISLLRGPGFTEAETTSKDHFVVVSKMLAARLFPNANPLGERLQLDDTPASSVGGIVTKQVPVVGSYLVVGVAADVKNSGLASEDLPEYYKLRRDRPEDWEGGGAWGASAVVLLRSSAPATPLAAWVKARVAAIDPELPVDVQTMRERISREADGPRFQMLLVGIFASSGLLLSLVGLYGVLQFLVGQQTREIGVRIALGAQRGSVFRLVFARSFRMVAAGAVLGIVSAAVLSRSVAAMLFQVRPYDPLAFAGVVALLLAVASIATFVPARHAADVDPVIALRHE